MVVALCLVVLLGFTALGVDVGGMFSDRQQLQNGADAGALAIAGSCQRGNCMDTADKYAKANKLNGQATGKIVAVGGVSGAALVATAGSVTVEADGSRQNMFGAVLGTPTTAIAAKATATWGALSGGPTLPLAFSWCAFDLATGGWNTTSGNPVNNGLVTVYLKDQTLCSPPAHNEVPGGFGWLTSTNCVAQVLAGNWVTSDPGIDLPSNCSNFDWTSLQTNTPFPVPIFQAVTGTGSNAQYQIAGVAAFIFTGYCFSNSVQWNLNQCPSNKRIQGYFVNFTVLGPGFSYSSGATQFGLGGVTLKS